MKKFFLSLLSDTNRVSSKRFIGLLCLVMFAVYGIFGIIYNVSINFWIFYVSLCAVTMWVAFRFTTMDKAMKYNVLGELGKFGGLSKGKIDEEVHDFIDNEDTVDNLMQPPEKIQEG